MKKITEICGSLTMLSLVVYSALFAKLFFDYTLYEGLLAITVDSIMAIVAMVTDPILFSFFFPETKPFFPKLDDKVLAQTSTKERLKIFEDICTYPKKRALYMIPANILKTTPALMVMIFVWDHGYSYSQATFYCFSIILLTVSYMCAMVYFENHYFLTEMIRDIDRKYHWSDVFDQVKSPSFSDVNFDRIATFTIVGICAWGGIMQLVIMFDIDQSASNKILRSVVAQIFMIAATLRVLLMSRKQLFLGLDSMLAYFNDQKKFEVNLMPLNTVPAVIYYQKIVNSLVKKIKNIEKEISDRILEWSEKRRFLDLGEISALVVHDLINPMHSLTYCIESIKEKNIPQISDYVTQIDWGLKYSTGLLENLKNNLKLPEANPTTSCLSEADTMVRKIVRYHFLPGQTDKVNFEIDIPTDMPKILMPQPDLNQIMTNLYTNSIKNMVSNDVPEPTVRIRILDLDNETCTLLFCDNGTGLNSNDFHFFYDKPGEKSKYSKGLGLKLTKRLIEYYKGSLSLSPFKEMRTGTAYIIRLPVKVAKL